MALPIMYNGIQFAPVSSKKSIVVPVSGDVLWTTVLGKFGRMALWMGSVEDQKVFHSKSRTVYAKLQLATWHNHLQGGEAADYVWAVRIFGVGEKMLFEQLTRLDHKEMIMTWQLTTHPMNSNPFPAAYVNCKASMQVIPISIPGGSAVAEWRIDCLTELQHVAHMTKALDVIMIHSFTNLLNFMQKSNSSEGASSVGAKTSDIRGSLVAPSAFGVQYMPQPNPAQMHFQTQPFSQAIHPNLTGGTPLLQQPNFVPAPESTSGTSEKQFQQQTIPPEVYHHFPLQQVLQQQIPQQLHQQLQQQQIQQQQQFQQQHQQLQHPQHYNHQQQQQQQGYHSQHSQHLLQQLQHQEQQQQLQHQQLQQQQHQQQYHQQQQQHQQQYHQQQQPQQHQQEEADNPEAKETS